MGSIRKQLWPNCLGRVMKTEKFVSIAGVQAKVLIGQLQVHVRSSITTARLLSAKQKYACERGTSAVVVDNFQFVWLK
jgi:hypothetical protein